MKLRRRLIELRAAEARVSCARQRCADDAVRLRRHIRRRPLIWVGGAGGVGLASGWVSGHPGGRVAAFWHDPMLRWVVRLLMQVP